SIENDHFLSEVYSGLPRSAGKRPAFGSIVSRLADGGSAMPAYVTATEAGSDQFDFQKPYYAGSNHGPFRPVGPAVADLKPVKSIDMLQDRKSLVAGFDAMRRDLDHEAAAGGFDQIQARAFDIITSPKVRDAFD